MTEFSVMYTMAAAYGALIAIYVILAVLIALGAFALVRLAVLAKLKRKPAAAKDCENCPDLKKKEEEAAALREENAQDKEDLKKKDEEIAALRERIRELEERASAPIVIPVETRTLSESLAAAGATSASGAITKKSIIAYLSEKYGSAVELNGRANRTPNGKLLMSDNHFAFAPDGKRVCFTYVYEDDDGRITILLRTTASHAKEIHAAHKATGLRSAFPKNKERDWYSVIVDTSFTEKEIYEVLDRAALNIIESDRA